MRTHRQVIAALALCGLLGSLALASFDWATRDGNPRDFGSFWESRRAANRGDDPYGVYEHTFA